MATKTKISTLATMTAVAALLLAGCSSSSDPAPKNEVVEEVETAEPSAPAPAPEPDPAPAPAPAPEPAPAPAGYQAIYDEYSARLTAECPSLSMMECAELSNEGVSEMADYMFRAKGTDGQMATYEEWAKKLMDVYMSVVQ